MEWVFGNDRPLPVEMERVVAQWRNIINFAVDENGGDEGQYKWLSLKLPPATWNRSAIVSSIIRLRYTADEVEAITCNVLGEPTNERVAEYRALQEWRKKAKDYATELMAWADEHGIGEVVGGENESYEPTETALVPDGIEMMMQAVSLAKSQAQELPDEQAAEVPALFPAWADLIGQQVEAGKRLFYAGRLWKVLQTHTIQENWTPDVAASLFTEVVAEQEGEIGTLDNPIPYNNNMELEAGKYYSQDGVVYRCFRSTGVPVYNPLAQLVGLYVEIVN